MGRVEELADKYNKDELATLAAREESRATSALQRLSWCERILIQIGRQEYSKGGAADAAKGCLEKIWAMKGDQ